MPSPQIPRRCFVCTGHAKVQRSGTVELRDLFSNSTALQCGILTRRRYPERPDCWHIYYGDVHVGTIAIRSGNPHDIDPWEWSCGFYPGSHRESIRATRQRRSTRPAQISRALGKRFYQSEPKPTSRHGASSGIGLLENMQCGRPARRRLRRSRLNWSRLSEQKFRVDKWSLCRVRPPRGAAED
jgi:hypothetical protein